jgi:Glycosyl hydrolases family 18
VFPRSRIRWIVATAAVLATAAAGASQAAAQAATGTAAAQATTGTAAAQATTGTAAAQAPSGAAGAIAAPATSGAAGSAGARATASSWPPEHEWPEHVYAPYYESWEPGGIAQSAAQSGSPYETIAFIQAPTAGSCSLTWNGDSTEPIPGTEFAADIASLQRQGGNVIPSFGGYGADSGGTEIADSCTDVDAIAADYESVISTYQVTRLDMDVEASSLTNTAGISRRNQAIKLTEQWAARRHLPLQVQYTIPVLPTGLTASGIAVLRSAIATGTRVDVVNIMTFDYYLASEPAPLDMGAEAISAARDTHTQLAAIYPHASPDRLWALEGMTLMPGIDDYPGKTEITSLADAAQVLDFAQHHGLALLSIWAIQRDNGGCPDTIGASTCSGITQNPWDFSHLLERFTR